MSRRPLIIVFGVLFAVALAYFIVASVPDSWIDRGLVAAINYDVKRDR